MSKDYYFAEEWKAAQAKGELDIAVAASRDQVCSSQFAHQCDVQRESTGGQGLRTAQDTRTRGSGLGPARSRWPRLHLWVRGCFSPSLERCSRRLHRAADKMPTAVRKALIEVAKEHGGLSEVDAKAYVEQLDSSRRLQEETWS